MLAARHFERQMIHVRNEFINGEYRQDNWREPGSSCENQRYDRGLQPNLARSYDETLDHHRAGCQVDRVDWPEVVVLAVENNEYGKGCQITPAEKPIRLQPGGEEKDQQTGDPDRREDRVNDKNLLGEIGRGRKDHVAAVGLDVVHELRKGPVILNIPEKIRKKNQKGERAAEPDPFRRKNAALHGQQQSNHDAKTEHGNRVLLLETNACDDAKPEPISRIVALDRQHCKINATHPEQWLEAIGAHDAAVVEIDGHSDERQRGKHHREPPATEFSSHHCGQNDRSRGCQRRYEPNTPKRVTQHEPGDLDEERHQGRMIHVTPGQMVPAGHVIEFVAEVTILIVEVEMQQEVREGEK